MYKILVVDDEILARQNIIFKIKKSGFNFDWIKEASDAEQALTVIEESKPDILVTDIKMRELDGIELIERIQQDSLVNMTYIIISGYSDFTYAQNAIRLNVADYLLKPVTQADLTASLNKAIELTTKQRTRSSALAKQELLQQQSTYNELAKNLNLLLNCEIKAESFNEQEYFKITPSYYCVVVCRVLSSGRAKFFDDSIEEGHVYQNYTIAKYAIKNIIQEIVPDNGFCFENENEYKQLVLVLAADAGNKALAEINIRQDVMKIYNNTKVVVGIELDMGISGISTKLSYGLMLQAKNMIDLRLSKSDHIYYYAENHIKATEWPDEAVRMFERSLSSGAIHTAKSMVEKIINAKQIEFSIRTLYIDLICILARVCFKKKIETTLILGTEVINGSIIDTFNTKMDMIEDINSRIDQLIVPTNVGYDNVNELLDTIQVYIDENFSDKNLSTNVIARKFCISLGYLSSSYSKVFGHTITNHIIKKRIEYAYKLLTQTNISITSISDMAGFNNISYFMRAFKKHTGYTPTEYREKYVN